MPKDMLLAIVIAIGVIVGITMAWYSSLKMQEAMMEKVIAGCVEKTEVNWNESAVGRRRINL